MKHRNIFITIITILVALTAAVFLRFFASPEDVWLCEDGEWIRHGSPSAEMPVDGCQQ